MKRTTLLALLFLLLLASCTEQKYIFKNNVISTIETTEKNGILTDSLHIYKVKTPFTSKIETNGDYIVLKSVNTINLTKVDSIKLTGAPKGTKKDFVGKYYYPELEQATIKKLTYFDTKPVLQGISIPLKIRPKLSTPALLDSFPSQAETGFNIAFAGGWKFNINTYSSKKDVFGKNVRQFSLTPGWLLGTGAVDLTKENTRSPIIEFKRKVLIPAILTT